MARQADLAKERFWRRLLKRWQRSQLTVRDYCAEQQVTEASFYAWRRTIADRDRDGLRSRSALEPPEAATSLPTFVPVRVVSATDSAAIPIEVVLGNGRVLRLTRGVDVDLLRQLLPLLEEPSC